MCAVGSPADSFVDDSADESDDSDGHYAVSVHGMDAGVAVQDLHTAEGNDLPQQTMWRMLFTLPTRCRRLLYKCELAIEQARMRLRKTGQESHSPSAWLRRLFDRVFVACESLLLRSSWLMAAMIIECDYHATVVHLSYDMLWYLSM